MRSSRRRQCLALGLSLLFVGCTTAEHFNQAYVRGANIKSMIAMKQVALALEAYRAEHGEYPAADSLSQLAPILGASLGDAHGIDRWGQSLIVNVTPNSYTITSKGDDKKGGHEDGGAVENAGHSITLENGVFVQYHRSVERTAREYEAEIAGARPPSDMGA